MLSECAQDRALITLAANYTVSDLAGWYAKRDATDAREDYADIDPSGFAELMRMLSAGELSSRGGKDVLLLMLDQGGDPRKLSEVNGLLQVSDAGALRTTVQEVIAMNEAVAAEYRAGKESALQFLVGACMKLTKGAGNPALLKELLIEELKA